ncbi:hydrolase, alpha beta fold family protein [Musa troglodytarum]|uniref:Hydrolase, alpha beta fold family protein n=1 Tax=Musa troglodytarum TaxID=320322 RepID=A0A9E7JSS1_9LILI|nr:hydrolase, alpha beta fold family protein [Musa troglodytarum]
MITNVRIAGKGEQAVVLSHGYGGSQSTWDHVVPHLSQMYRLLLFDWNFEGAVDASKYSSFTAFADALIALIDRLKLKGTVFLGHSMSGMIGCIASVKRPDLFSHLVLIAASPRYLNSDDYYGGFERAEIDDVLSNIEFNFDAWAENFIVLVIGADDPISVDKLGRSFKSMRSEIALALAKTIFLGDMRHTLDKVEVPCTVIQVSNDFVAPVSVGRYMQNRIKGKATLEMIDSDGHFPHLTVPHKLLEILDRVMVSNKPLHG